MKKIIGITLFVLAVSGSLTANAQNQIAPAKKGADNKVAISLPAKYVDQMSWRSIGPANMSGRITSIAVYEKDPSTWWVSSASGGLLKTVNNGVTFEHQFDDQSTVSIGDVQVAQSNKDILWVGTGEANPRNSVSWGDGVYKSTDGGKSWKNMGLKKTFQIGRIAIHPKNPDIVYVGALGRLWGPSEDRGLYKTTDGGKTWKKILYVDDKTGVIDMQMDLDNPNRIYVATYERKRDGFDGNDPEVKHGTGSAIYRTDNGGKTFKKLTKGLPTCKLGRMGLSIYRKDSKYVYAIIESEKIGKMPDDLAYAGLSGTNATDIGVKITAVTKGGPSEKGGLKVNDLVISANGQILHTYDDFLKIIRNSKVGSEIKMVCSRDKKSVDVKIKMEKRPPPAADPQASKSGPSKSKSKAGKKSEPSKSEPSKSKASETGKTKSSASKSGRPQTTQSTRRRPTRTEFSGTLGGQAANRQDFQGPNGHEYGGIYRSNDYGDSWTRINSLNPRPMYYSQIRVDPSDNNHIFVCGTSLYRSKDGGKTFSGDGGSDGIHVDHHALWIDPSDGRHQILGNDGGIHVTFDRMNHWDHLAHVAIGQFYHVGISHDDDYYVYGGLQDNGSWGGPSRSAHGSIINSDWFRVGGGDGFICLVDPEDPNQIYTESQNGAMGRTNLKTGARGFIRPRPPSGTQYRFNWKTPFILSPHNSRVHYSAGNFVFRSPYKGDKIKAISPEITNTDKGAGSAISESAVEEGVLYVGTTDGALWASRDGGINWVNLFKDPDKIGEAPKGATTNGQQMPNLSGGASRPQSGRPGGAGRGGAGRGGAGRGGGGRGGGGAGRMREMLESRDANKDGKISKDELPEQMQRIMDRLDSNKDGVIDKKELDAMGSGRGGRRASSDAAPDSDTVKPEPPSPQQDQPTKKSAAKSNSKSDPTSKPQKSDDPISGTWSGRFVNSDFPGEFTLKLKLVKGKITGTYESSRADGEISDGKIEGNKVSFTGQTGAEIKFAATISGSTMKGNLDVDNGRFSVEFEATKKGGAEAGAQPKSTPGNPIKDLVPGPRWVSSLEASKFKPGRCYMTLDGHRSNDDEPYVFKTENYGKSWTSIRANLPTEAGSTRVIREDVVNENLLYLGCEFSCWVSIDRGQSWTRLNGNLPTVSVHEFAIHPTRGEVVAATHGRSLWILDVSALRQLSAEKLAVAATLYDPSDIISWTRGKSRGSSGTRRFQGQNPSSGTKIFYSLGNDARSVNLTITNLAGDKIYSVDGVAGAAPSGSNTPVIENGTRKGLHSITWSGAAQRQQSSRGGRRRFSRRATPGDYLVTLTVDGNSFKQTVSIKNDPTVPPAETTEAEIEFMNAMMGEEEGESVKEPSKSRID